MTSAAALALGCTTGTPAQKSAGGEALPEPSRYNDVVSAELDSLAALSVGPYVHLRVGQCFGWCDARVSIWRDSPAHRYVYLAEGWQFDHEERRPVRFRLERPISQAEATEILTGAVDAGLFTLVGDTTMAITDQPYVWLRAGGGPQALRIDHAYTGGELFMADDGARSKTFRAVQDALLARLFRPER
jgi:hypothetical protein